MKLRSVHVAHPVTLAAMEEHGNYPFRLLAREFGASLVVTERVDSDDVANRQRRAMRLLHTTPAESPRAGQTSGADPATMAAAARVIEELGFDLVDLNFECPIRRLVSRGEGGALLADPPRVASIVAAVVRAVTIPVTLKIRSGPDAENETAVEIARRAEEAGAAGVCVHGRSVAQGYVGGPDWDVIARVKQAVGIPVIGSGGIREAADVVRLLRHTGADAVGVARGCLGNPWIFRQARAALSGSGAPNVPSPAERGRVLLRLVEGEFRFFGSTVALRRLPRTAGYFGRWLADPSTLIAEIRKVKSLQQFRRVVREQF
jgi:tRNA-dihydrouridine synthase B